MLRRHFLRIAVVGTTVMAAGLAHAGGDRELHAVPCAVGEVGVGADQPMRLGVTADALRAAAIARRDEDADDYFASFGIARGEVGIAGGRVSVVTTRLDGALAEVVEDDDALYLVWDGVAYRVET